LFIDQQPDGSLTIKPEVQRLIEDDEQLKTYLQSVIDTIPNIDNPSELIHFNYCYIDGKLVNQDTGKPFHWVNQAHYDALGDIIVKHIQNMMVKEYGLKEVWLPIDQHYTGTGPRCNIFMSEDALTCQNLVLLIQGAGAVRAGQWARALCINENLSIGTIFPYLVTCKELGYGVIVFNPNLNELPLNPQEIKRESFLPLSKVPKRKNIPTVKIKENENYRKHGEYVWDNFVNSSLASTIAIVAHSRGGDNAVKLLEKRYDQFVKRVCAVAFTDSVHGLGFGDRKEVVSWIKANACNWVTSKLPMGEFLSKPSYDCIRRSAGHHQHEHTSGYAIDGVFEFLVEKIQNFPKKMDEEQN